MKKLIFIFVGVLSILFFSCEKIKDATAVDIDTVLKTSVPVSTQNAAAIVVKSVKVANEDVYNFGGSGSISIANNNDLKNYIDNIRSIIAEAGGLVTFLGAADGNSILTCTLKYGVETTPGTAPSLKSAFTIPSAILENAGVIEYASDAWQAKVISDLSGNLDKTIVFEIEGTANYDIATTVQLSMPVKVSASPL